MLCSSSPAASQRGDTGVGGPCRCPHPREPVAGQARPAPARGGEAVPGGRVQTGTGAGRELRSKGSCCRARRRVGAQGGGAGGTQQRPPAPWSRQPKPASVGPPAPVQPRTPAGLGVRGQSSARGRRAGDRGLSLGTGQACQRCKVVQSYSRGASGSVRQLTLLFLFSFLF